MVHQAILVSLDTQVLADIAAGLELADTAALMVQLVLQAFQATLVLMEQQGQAALVGSLVSLDLAASMEQLEQADSLDTQVKMVLQELLDSLAFLVL